MKKRHKSRELALQTLYACDMGAGNDWCEVLNSITETNTFSPEVEQFARRLIAKTRQTQEEADALIRRHAANWKLERMAAIDRNILRMAITELRYFTDAPSKVVIDEAVELAKKFSTEESSRFVNGVVDSIYKEMIKASSIPPGD